MNRAQSIVTSGPNGVGKRMEDLPVHHKLIIVGCYLLRRQRGKQEVPFTELCETYGSICRNHKFTGLGESELVTICGLLESRGYLDFSVMKGNASTKRDTPARFRSVKLRLDDCTVQQLLSDDLFSRILSTTL
ncbi:unnamed protein product [Echinostoma caproni]|uniref:Cdc6_C domain-containing protein n=1 Tax=Echinostoma caproni TaxID=27848 RepID=A0A183A176_9TREM|nr:unnamed protein product [Echinostoma caproni]